MIYNYIALENDKNTLKSIANKEYNIKTFDYDGQKYNSDEANSIINKIEDELSIVKVNIQKMILKFIISFKEKPLKMEIQIH